LISFGAGRRTPDQDRCVPLRRLEIIFSQGAAWKALISKYIGTIPLSGDAARAAEQSISGGPPPTPVSSTWNHKSVLRLILRDGHFVASSG
jgi:hypothetical protein